MYIEQNLCSSRIVVLRMLHHAAEQLSVESQCGQRTVIQQYLFSSIEPSQQILRPENRTELMKYILPEFLYFKIYTLTFI